MSKKRDPILVTRPLLPDLNDLMVRLQDVWDSKWLSNGGHQHNTLEQRIRERLDVPNVSLFSNGTIALLVAIQSLRLQGEVITTPFTFPATTHVLWWNGVQPVFADIDPETMTLDPASVERVITHRTSGILGVHVYGIPCDVAALGDIADRHGLRVIYDAAHAFEAEIDGVGIGNFGDISMFSFHPTKLFHSGEGGCLTYRDPNLKARIDLLKNFGIRNEFEVIMPGINGKMNELQAALGHLVLEIVDEERARRLRIRQQYERELGDLPGLVIPKVGPGVKDSGQYFVIRIKASEFGADRDQVYDALRSQEIFARKYFFPLTSDYTCYRSLSSARPELLPNAHMVAGEVLCLPYFGELTEDNVSEICDVIRSLARPAAV